MKHNNDLNLTLKTKQCKKEHGIICADIRYSRVTHSCDGTRTLSLLTPGHSELDHDYDAVVCIHGVLERGDVRARSRTARYTPHANTNTVPHLTSTICYSLTSIVVVLLLYSTYSRRGAIQTPLSLLFVCQLEHTKKYTLCVDINTALFCIEN